MEIEFGTKDLTYYYHCHYSGKQPYSEIILRKYRKVVTHMTEADNIVILSKICSLNIEKYQKHWSARIDQQFRLEFDFIKPNTIRFIKISKHYE